ncbi:MAG: baseplate J/gp47 family protein [Candidatus Omnitrophica bacterium]|nr:baseplate J/gp47 family protein [Candidatus Omnitrophota bacterium]
MAEQLIEYNVKAGDTLQVIAQKYYGDALRWYEIAMLNNLDYPFITEEDSFQKDTTAAGAVRFYRASPELAVIYIPMGTIVSVPATSRSDERRYVTTVAAQIASYQSSVVVPVVAINAGAKGNCAPRQISGVLSDVYSEAATVSGAIAPAGVNGIYKPAESNQGYIAYKHVTEDYYLWGVPAGWSVAEKVAPPDDRFFTDFSEYTTGVKPSDWTERFSASGNWYVREKEGTTGGKCLENGNTLNFGMRLVAWDDIAAKADVEIVSRLRSSVTGGDYNYLVVRAAGTASTMSGYSVGLYGNGTGIVLNRLAGAGVAGLAIYSYPWQADTWYWMRFRAIGTSLKAKIWADGESEPAEWHIDATNDVVSAGGWVGVGLYASNRYQDFDCVGVGVDGADAPVSSVNNAIMQYFTNSNEERSGAYNPTVYGEGTAIVTCPVSDLVAAEGIVVSNDSLVTGGESKNVKKVGERLLLLADPDLIEGGVTGLNEAQSEDFYSYILGEDLYLNEGGELEEDIGASFLKDVRSVSGLDNLVQSLNHRLATRKGELVFHPMYGSLLEDIVGRRGEPQWLELAAIEVKRVVGSDPRIKEVISVEGDFAEGVLAFECQAYVIGETVPANFVLQYRRGG